MPYEKAPSSGAFLPLSLMYFLSGKPMHFCSGVDSSTPPGQPFASLYGSSSVTLIVGQLPAHTHQLFGSTATNSTDVPTGAILPTFPTGQHIYAPAGSPANAPMAGTAIGATGNNQPVQTQSPSLALNWCVAIVGIYPSRP